jgi:hypothetical protein
MRPLLRTGCVQRYRHSQRLIRTPEATGLLRWMPYWMTYEMILQPYYDDSFTNIHKKMCHTITFKRDVWHMASMPGSRRC